MKNLTRICLLLACFLAGTGPVLFAQAPSNDNCDQAVALTPAVSCNPISGSTELATPSNEPGDCGIATNDVWYSFVATAPEHSVMVYSDNGFDAVVGALTGCGNTDRPLGGTCVDGTGSGGPETLILQELTVGSTYYLQVSDAFGATSTASNFSICVSAATPNPSNPCNAVTITPVTGNGCTPVDFYSTGLTNVADQVAPAPGCSPFAGTTPNGWATFTTATPQHIRIGSAGGSISYDNVMLALYRASNGCVGADMTLLACNNQYINLLNQPAGTYYLRYWDYFNGSGDLALCVATEDALPPANDDCANAVMLTPDAGCNPVTGSTENASASNAAGDCNGGNVNDVWYSFVATAPEHTVTVDGDAGFDAVIGVLTSCDGTERPLGGYCVSATGEDGEETLTLWELTVGATYYIQVYDAYNRNFAGSTFIICVSAATPNPSNPCNAITITPVTGNTCTPGDNYSTGPTANAYAGAPAPFCTPFYATSANGWLTFTTTTAQNIYVAGAPGSFSGEDAALAVYSASGPCADLTLLACNNPAEIALLNQPAGTYYIRFWNYYGIGGNLNICVATTDAIPPANDDCANAVMLTPDAGCNPVTGSTENAAASNAAGDCNGGNVNDVWYSFVATAPEHTVTVDGDAGFDAVIGVLTSCDGTERPLGGYCVSATGEDGEETLTLWELTVGATYYIQVYDAYNRNFAGSTFSICVSAATPNPSNPCNAITITPVTGNTCTPGDNYSTGPTTSADATGVPYCAHYFGPTTPSGWLTFATTTAQNIYIYSASGSLSSDNIVLSLYYSPTASCSDLTFIDCNYGGFTLTNQPAGTYYVRFLDYYNGSGNINLCVATEALPPVNDECTGAIPISDGSTISMSTLAATNDLPEMAPDCGIGQTDHGVWFVYTAADNTSGTVTLSGCNTDFDSKVNVYTTSDNSCPGAGNVSTCVIATDNDDDCNGPGSDFAESTTFSYANLTANAQFVPAGKNYYVFVFGGGGALDFTVSSTVLPLELLSFTGKIEGKVNVLHWETSTERNVRSHIVERSADGINWQEIGRKEGSVYSNEVLKYTLEDRHPLPKSYYRLRSVDLDGQESRYNTILLNRPDEQFGITSVYPSPANDQVTVQFSALQEETVQVKLLDMMGRLLLAQSIEAKHGVNTQPVALPPLPAGIYMFQVSNEITGSAPVRFIKE